MTSPSEVERRQRVLLRLLSNWHKGISEINALLYMPPHPTQCVLSLRTQIETVVSQRLEKCRRESVEIEALTRWLMKENNGRTS